MAVRKVFKKQMKTFAVEMLEEYAKTTDNDVDFGDDDSVTLVGTSQNDASIDDSLRLTTQVRVDYGYFKQGEPALNQ